MTRVLITSPSNSLSILKIFEKPSNGLYKSTAFQKLIIVVFQRKNEISRSRRSLSSRASWLRLKPQVDDHLQARSK